MNRINTEGHFTSLPAHNSYLVSRPNTPRDIVSESIKNIKRKAYSPEYNYTYFRFFPIIYSISIEEMYQKACRKFQKLVSSDTSKLTVGFSMLLDANADPEQLNLWTETFTYLESKGLDTGYYTGAFIDLIQTPGITFNALKLFACSAVALIENEQTIDELTDDVIKSLKRDDRPQREQEAWIREHCSYASMQAGGMYVTRRDRIKKNVVGAVLATIIKAPFLILRILG